jgi:hypothetical protein
MADPQTAVLTQLRNIQGKTGKTLAELHAAVAGTGLAKHGERRSWLMEHFKLGYGDANAVANFIGKPLPELGSATAPQPASAAGADSNPAALDSIYSGNKAHLRPLHEAVMDLVRSLGAFEEAPKKGYISLRRKKQFAMLGPATREALEIGLNAKSLPADVRLKVQPPGSMCTATTRVSHVQEVDAALKAWLQAAFDAAG